MCNFFLAGEEATEHAADLICGEGNAGSFSAVGLTREHGFGSRAQFFIEAGFLNFA
jgi:hypothetical protein